MSNPNIELIAEFITNTSLFGNLSEQDRLQIAEKMVQITYDSQSVIVKEGDQGESLYIILDGLVEVLGKDTLSSNEFVLTHLGPGDCFGEMSVLTGERRSATVRAFEETQVYQLDSNSFNDLILNSPHMGLSISKILAKRLAKLNNKYEELRGQQTAINKMVNTDLDISSEIALEGKSSCLKAIRYRVNKLANYEGVIAIRGKEGVGKSAVARLIHRSGIRISEPFLVYDCINMDYEAQNQKLFGEDAQVGLVDLAQKGTILIKKASNLDPDIYKNLLSYNAIYAATQDINFPLFVCTFQDSDYIADSLLAPERIIELPPLVQRKQDIPFITKKILERIHKTKTSKSPHLTDKAMNKLLEYDWPGNITELISVIEQAVVLSQDLAIDEEQIIFDLPSAMQDPYLESVKSLALALDAKDPYTAGHSERVAMYSRKIAKMMNLPEEFIDRLYTMALFHDVGKIGVPETILKKQSHLTHDEYVQIQKHPESSLRILKPLKKYENDIGAVLHHHTNYDGTGYPGGISGDSIPIGARIISVADTYDAMTTDRPYRKSLGLERARKELDRVSGKQLDPEVTAVMLKIIDDGIKLHF